MGAYQKEEWSSFSDIGHTFGHKKLTYDEYLAIENKYIEAVVLFMDYLKIESLMLSNLEKKDKHLEKNAFYDQKLATTYKKLKIGQHIKKQEISYIIRLTLRENIWCKLEDELMYVHFGYDYYMYIGSPESTTSVIQNIEKSGLFVESFESPYTNE